VVVEVVVNVEVVGVGEVVVFVEILVVEILAFEILVEVSVSVDAGLDGNVSTVALIIELDVAAGSLLKNSDSVCCSIKVVGTSFASLI
jgi:hypothetical protein